MPVTIDNPDGSPKAEISIERLITENRMNALKIIFFKEKTATYIKLTDREVEMLFREFLYHRG